MFSDKETRKNGQKYLIGHKKAYVKIVIPYNDNLLVYI